MALTTTHKNALKTLAEEEGRLAQTAGSIVADLKASQFFSENWDELLLAAPNCLELLGNVNAVAATELAQKVTITAPKGGFRYLKGYKFLKGSLCELSNQGSRSFAVARKNMFSIQERSGAVNEHVKIIIMALSNPEAPMSSVLLRLGKLKSSADTCHQNALEIETSMSLWVEFVMELYEACNSESSSVEARRQDAKIQEKLAQKEVEERGNQEKFIKGELLKMGQELKDAKEAYKDALDKMPTGMELAGQQILMGLGEAVGSAITIGATAGAAYLNPAAGVTSAVKELSTQVDKFAPKSEPKQTPAPTAPSKTEKTPRSDTKTKQDATTYETAATEGKTGILKRLTTVFSLRRAKPKIEEEGKNVEAAGEDGNTHADQKTQKAVEAENVTATDAPSKRTYGSYDLSGTFSLDDPALSVIPAVQAAIDGIEKIISGSPNGIDWDAVLPPKDSDIASDLSQFSYTLGRKMKDFRPRKGGLASQLTIAIIQEAMGVADEIAEEAKKSISLSTWVKPDTKSAIYKDWDERISNCASAAITLCSASKATPGGPANPISLNTPQQTPEEKIASMNHKASIAEQTVKSATLKMKSTQETYKATLDTYVKTTDQVLQVQEGLIRARLEVEGLKADQMSLEEVKKVLISCIGYLTELKARITKLVTFFSRLTTLIDVCVTEQVQPFKEEIEMYAKENKTKAALYGDYYRDIIFRMTMQIMANFSLFKDIAGMYMQVDKECIEGGLLLVDKLNISNIDPNVSSAAYLAQQKKHLSDYCKKAEVDVSRIVKTKQQEIIDGLEKRIKNIQDSLDRFPAEYQPDKTLDKPKVQAIEDGAALAKFETLANTAAAPSAIKETVASGLGGRRKITIDLD